MRVLVTGGAGFIGSHFVRRLAARGDEVVVLDKLTYAGNPANLDGVEHEFVAGRHRRPGRGRRGRPPAATRSSTSPPRPTSTARSSARRSSSTPTCSGRCACSSGRARTTPASSRSRPTRCTATSRRAGGRVEGDPLRPSSPYSAAKAGGDLQVLAYVRTYGVRASITRGANTYGPNQYPEKLVPLFVTNALEGEPLPVYGDGKQVREWLHAEDHCAGIELVLHEGAPGEIYNVGGEDHENIEVTHRILELTGADPVAHPPRRGPGRPRPPLRGRRRASSARSAGRREHSFGEGGLPATVDWYREQPRLVGADQVRRVPRLLRRAVRKPTQGLSRLTENSSVRYSDAAYHRPPRRARPRRRGRRGDAPARRRDARSGDVHGALSAPVYVLTGGGYGHGVGLNQYGALGAGQGRVAATATSSRSTTRARSSAKAPVAKVRVLVADAPPVASRSARRVPFSRHGRDSGAVTPLAAGELVAQARPEGRRRREAEGAPRPARLPAGQGRDADARRQGLPRRAPRDAVGRRRLQVVDVVGLDAYLLGVVPGEMPKEWPAAALQAQAVAARSYALASIVKNRPFDLYADTRSQMYYGVAAESPSTTAAVKATRGEILTYGGKVVTAFYYSSSGGRTASSADVFGRRRRPTCRRATTRGTRSRPTTAGRRARSPRRRSRRRSGSRRPSSTWSSSRPPSGRPASVTLVKKTGPEGAASTAADVRARLGLRSTAFRLGVLRVARPPAVATRRSAGRRLRPRPRRRSAACSRSSAPRRVAAVGQGRPGERRHVRRHGAAQGDRDLPAHGGGPGRARR